MIKFSDPRTHELVMEDPVLLNDGLASCLSAVVQFDPRCSDNFVQTFFRLQQLGLIKVKNVKLKKKRDWIKV